MTKAERNKAVKEWEDHHSNMLRDVTVNMSETESDKLIRRTRLEKEPEEWFRHYFPKYYSAEAAPFQKKSTRRLLANLRVWIMRKWSRELAKSTRTMMEVLYLMLVKKEVSNTLMVANNEKDAIRLLTPYKINLQKNKRIIHDYGRQQGFSQWKAEEFITRDGASFRAIGAGQSPRGTRAEEKRVDCIIIDDIDTDEECRNEMRIRQKFEWIQDALLPTVSISGNYRIITCGNVIAKVCTVELCSRLADYVEVVNIRDKNGKSSWEKNSEEDIEDFFKKLSYRAIQKEFFNNPIIEGTVFTTMQYKPARPLRDYRYLLCYTDPSFKDSKKNDYKATVLVGRYKSEYHIIKAYCDQVTTGTMIDWHYQIAEWVDGRVPVYYYMEANFLQDTILAEFWKEAANRKYTIPIKGDMRKKPDKFTRIESLLEPLNSNGQLFLNERERKNPHMVTLEEQFKMIEPGSRAHDDAPDAVEGAVFLINQKDKVLKASSIDIRQPRRRKSKRF